MLKRLNVFIVFCFFYPLIDIIIIIVFPCLSPFYINYIDFLESKNAAIVMNGIKKIIIFVLDLKALFHRKTEYLLHPKLISYLKYSPAAKKLAEPEKFLF